MKVLRVEFTSYFDYDNNCVLYQFHPLQVNDKCKLVFNRVLPQYWNIQLTFGTVKRIDNDNFTVIQISTSSGMDELNIYEIKDIQELVELKFTIDETETPLMLEIEIDAKVIEKEEQMTLDKYTRHILEYPIEASLQQLAAPIPADLMSNYFNNILRPLPQPLPVGVGYAGPPNLIVFRPMPHVPKQPSIIYVNLKHIIHVPENFVYLQLVLDDYSDMAYKIEDYVTVDYYTFAERCLISLPHNFVDIIHKLECEVIHTENDNDRDVEINFQNVSVPILVDPMRRSYPKIVPSKYDIVGNILIKITMIFSVLSPTLYNAKNDGTLKIVYVDNDQLCIDNK